MKALRTAICAAVLSIGLIPLSATAADAAQSGSQAAPADAPTVTQQQYDAQMQRMQDMHQRMMQARTPAERQRLMNENMKLMQDSMTMMQGNGNWNTNMHGGGMGMSGSGHMGMMGNSGAGMPGNCMGMGGGNYMGNCMGMMNMMMQLMQDQQNAYPKTK